MRMHKFNMMPDDYIRFPSPIKKQKVIRKEYHRLYKTGAWKKLRAKKLKAHPLCELCLNDSFGAEQTRATIADHIKPHKGDHVLFFSYKNLQSLCKKCHNRKSRRERYAHNR